MLQTLELANVRSYKNGLFQFSDSVNIIVGPNASGKTNLLEAIHMVCKGEAFKSDDANMINHDSEWARIDCQHDDHKIVVKLKKTPLSKTFIFDDLDKKRFPVDKNIPVVLFEPTHLLLLGGEPERRRSYIDNLLTQTVAGYGALLKSYKRIVSQRNRLLKQETISPEHLFVWDVQLSDIAGKVVDQRVKYTDFLHEQLTENYQSVSGNEEKLNITYESKISGEHYANELLKKLKHDFALDKVRGYTGAGPHRDDLKITIEGHDVRDSASRGETRSIVLALKMAELNVLEQKTGKRPLLLLDDVFSELDGKRRRTLSQTLQKYQTFITTTDADVVIEHFSKSCNIIPTNG
jgi:DNA replication and repair protein RecF